MASTTPFDSAVKFLVLGGVLLVAMIFVLPMVSQKWVDKTLTDGGVNPSAVTPTPVIGENLLPPAGVSGDEELFGSLELDDAGFCGNGVCESSEYCSTCTLDCGCTQGNYCNRVSNSCLAIDSCGDGVCTPNEENDASCVLDCGCEEGKLYNNELGGCVATLDLPQSVLDKAVTDYSKKTGKEYVAGEASDSFFGTQAVKEVRLTCVAPDSCELTILVDKFGKVVGESLVA